MKRVGGRVWMALAWAVPAHLWLGGAVRPRRERERITALVQQVRACTRRLDRLGCVEGLSSSVTAARRGFRDPVYTGRRGRPRLGRAAGFPLGQVGKQEAQRRGVSVRQRVVEGTAAGSAAVLAATGTGQSIHTASSERVNATLRRCLAPVVRRGRAIAHQGETLAAGRYRVGSAYHFCWEHARLRRPAPPGAGGKWPERTPAMAVGLTDHRWSLQELLRYQVPLPAWVAPKRRGRPPKQTRPPTLAVAA